jgi:hypothetical protein
MMEVGKLYLVRENPLLVYSDADMSGFGKRLNGVPLGVAIELLRQLNVIDTCQPFLILDRRYLGPRRGVRYNVLFGDKKGWIQIQLDNEVEEVK